LALSEQGQANVFDIPPINTCDTCSNAMSW
jgi:hypothetical protein